MKNSVKVGHTGDTSNVGLRDAFHVPCVLVTCDTKTFGGMSVKFVDPTKVIPCDIASSHGVADPFLSQILPGQAFWVFVKPDLVNSLVHNFEVPGVLENVDKEKADKEKAVLTKQLEELKANFQKQFDNQKEMYQAQLRAFQEKYDDLQDDKEVDDQDYSEDDGCRGCYN